MGQTLHLVFCMHVLACECADQWRVSAESSRANGKLREGWVLGGGGETAHLAGEIIGGAETIRKVRGNAMVKCDSIFGL